MFRHQFCLVFVLLGKLLLVAPGAVLDVENSSGKESITCARTTTRITEEGDSNSDQSSTELPYIKCETDHCYAFWQKDVTNGTVTIMGQGCWESSGNSQDCERDECVSDKKPPRAMNNTKFCCCKGDRCNENFIDAYVPGKDSYEGTGSEYEDGSGTASSRSPIPTLKQSREPYFFLVLLPICFLIISVVAISSMVWYAKKKTNKNDIEMGLPSVAPPDQYSLDKLKLCATIGQGRYGCVWRGLVEDQEVAVKVFSPHHRSYFLNEHELYKLAGECAALLKCFGGGERLQNSGGPLSDYVLIFSLERECLQEYLKEHTVDLQTLSKMALSIAKGLAHLHSDLDKPCVAHRDVNTRNVLVKADLSCCICDLGLAIVPRRNENHTLSEAGTLRYMAPEVLEGAVNLRDCESALKQIDVYALGLVLWELGTRCSDMQIAEPPRYSPPFYKEVGENPSLEQMQALVSRRKARPLWPVSWRDTAAARLLCETAEDCWDQDAEARLTSLCVEERLLELPTLRGRVLHPMHPPASPTPLINNNHLHDRFVDSSVGTVETLLSPTEEYCKNSNRLVECHTSAIQPYQGRNPCMERNLLSGSSDCLLVDKSSKHSTNSDSHDLIANDFLSFQVNHRALPIPYLQNAFHGSPKKYNCANNVAVASKTSKFSWSNLKRLFNGKHGDDSSSGNAQQRDTKVEIVRGKLVNGSACGPVTATTLIDCSETKRPDTLDIDNTSHTSGVAQLSKPKDDLRRQHSLERFAQVFSSVSDLSKLKDPSSRVKTPGDVPPSVRRTRGRAANRSVAARFSLYDDRMMWGSAPDLEPVEVAAPRAANQQEEPSTFCSNDNTLDRESIGSF